MKKKIIVSGVVPVSACLVVETELSDKELVERLSIYEIMNHKWGEFDERWDIAQIDEIEIDDADEGDELDDIELEKLFVDYKPPPINPEDPERLARRQRAIEKLKEYREKRKS